MDARWCPPPPVDCRTWAVIAISSGKGGVGKSTVAANLAVALASQGHRVGLMDGDIYGPNIPRMFGVFERPIVNAGGGWCRSGVRGEADLARLHRRAGRARLARPIIMKIVRTIPAGRGLGGAGLFRDLPPGTGGPALAGAGDQRLRALIITTPQELSVGDALRGAKMFRR
jgi:ATP-binding protein involved in chromosome partitioning